MDRYRAVTEYRFDWRTEREPSWDDIVFWRETGMKEDDEEVEALEGACSMETAMMEVYCVGSGGCRSLGTADDEKRRRQAGIWVLGVLGFLGDQGEVSLTRGVEVDRRRLRQ